MDTEEFKQRANELIEFISEYNDGVGDLDVSPDVHPGFLTDQLPGNLKIFKNHNKFFVNLKILQILLRSLQTNSNRYSMTSRTNSSLD